MKKFLILLLLSLFFIPATAFALTGYDDNDISLDEHTNPRQSTAQADASGNLVHFRLDELNFGSSTTSTQKTLYSSSCVVYGWKIVGSNGWAMLFDGPYFSATQVNGWTDGGITFVDELAVTATITSDYTWRMPNGVWFANEVSVTRSATDIAVFVYYKSAS